MNSEFCLPIRVYIEDTDVGGIVFYGNYLKFMERARTEFLRACGFAKPAIPDSDRLLVVSSVNVNYRKSARLDDELLVSARIVKLARTYITFQQNVYRDGELLVEGEVKVACVSRDSMRPNALPDEVRKKLSLKIE